MTEYAWNYHLDEAGTLWLYLGPRLYCTVESVEPYQVDNLVEELIYEYMDGEGMEM